VGPLLVAESRAAVGRDADRGITGGTQGGVPDARRKKRPAAVRLQSKRFKMADAYAKYQATTVETHL